MNQRPLRTLVPMLALVAAAAVPLLAQPATEAPVLRVRGAAEVRIVPDLAVVRLGVANEAPTAQEAQQAVNEASEAILDAVRRAGIDEQNVQTVRLVLSPIYSSRRQGDTQEPRIVGYRASNTVSVRAEDSESRRPGDRCGLGRWCQSTRRCVVWIAGRSGGQAAGARPSYRRSTRKGRSDGRCPRRGAGWDHLRHRGAGVRAGADDGDEPRHGATVKRTDIRLTW